LKQIHKLWKDSVRKPRAIIKKYTERGRESLSILHQNQPWRYSDLSRKVSPAFVKMRGWWKVHLHTSEILQARAEKRADVAMAMPVQLLKCVHQVALDGGNWQSGQMLLLHPAPLAPIDFGGEPEEMEAVYVHHKALAELKKAHRRVTGKGAEKPDSDSDEETAAAKKKKRDKKKKGKDGAKAEGKGE
jgi:hypothetical protein